MNRNDNKEFFECLGEIWRDITAIEFLMRCAIAKKDGDINTIPKPPFEKDKTYIDYPDSFSHYSFEVVVAKFNKRFPNLKIPEELVSLRADTDLNLTGAEVTLFRELAKVFFKKYVESFTLVT